MTICESDGLTKSKWFEPQYIFLAGKINFWKKLLGDEIIMIETINDHEKISNYYVRKKERKRKG